MRASTPTDAIMGRLLRLTLTVFALSTLLSPTLAAEGSATRGQRVFASPTWAGMINRAPDTRDALNDDLLDRRSTAGERTQEVRRLHGDSPDISVK
jgi:hypothetical protein